MSVSSADVIECKWPEFHHADDLLFGWTGRFPENGRLVTDDREIARRRRCRAVANHLRVGIETAARNIERAVNKALA